MAPKASLLAALATLAAAVPISHGSDVVDLGYARYRGLHSSSLGLTTYYGIPYAQPPVGDLRWRPAQPIESPLASSNSSVIDATAPGTQCPQFEPTWYKYAIAALWNPSAIGLIPPVDEDCLHLDVIVPDQPIFSHLPVVVQIHGGGYNIGSSLTSDGTQFTAVANGSLIYVQIQYRLGLYGFLSSRDIRQDGTANAGLLDQRAALEWVQRHISAFGGDPDKVTIWGGSAGGASVAYQMALHAGDLAPPFRAAIFEYPWWQPLHDDKVLETQYTDLLTASGCDSLECLRELDSETLTNASQAVLDIGYAAGSYGFGDYYFGPSVDGSIIRDLPSNEFRKGNFVKIPLLVDHDAYEGVILTNLSIATEGEVLRDLQALWPNAPSSFLSRLVNVYYPPSSFSDAYFDDPIQSNYSTLAASLSPPTAATSYNISRNVPFYTLQTIFADSFIACPSFTIASAMTDKGQHVWKMKFAAGQETHGATAQFLFSAPTITSQEAAARAKQRIDADVIAAFIKDYFISFIVNGGPNVSSSVEGKPTWQEYSDIGNSNVTNGTFRALEFNQTSIGVNVDSVVSSRCDYLAGWGYAIRN